MLIMFSLTDLIISLLLLGSDHGKSLILRLLAPGKRVADPLRFDFS